MKVIKFLLLFVAAMRANAYPDDGAFCIVDLKFDGNIKICEFGQGTVSQFNGYDALYGQGAMFKLAWNALHRLYPRLAFVNGDRRGSGLCPSYAPGVLGKLGACWAPCVQQLNRRFEQKYRSKRCADGACGGAIITFNTHVLRDVISNQKETGVAQQIVLDRSTTYWVNNKEHTQALFEDEFLQKFRPVCNICPKAISEQDVQQIMQQNPSDFYVIKPLNASRGRGVIMVARGDVVKTIRSLFIQKNATMLGKDPAYAYWPGDKNDSFLLEQFCASKTIYVDGRAFDPTMRVAFILNHCCGASNVIFLDAYWKLPECSLDQEGSMTQKHKSHISQRSVSACAVDKNDFTQIADILEPVLIYLYEKMLAKTYSTSIN